MSFGFGDYAGIESALFSRTPEYLDGILKLSELHAESAKDLESALFIAVMEYLRTGTVPDVSQSSLKVIGNFLNAETGTRMMVSDKSRYIKVKRDFPAFVLFEAGILNPDGTGELGPRRLAS